MRYLNKNKKKIGSLIFFSKSNIIPKNRLKNNTHESIPFLKLFSLMSTKTK